jgi:hypothetical protein
MDHISGTIYNIISKDTGNPVEGETPYGLMTIINSRNGQFELVGGSIVNWLTKGQYVSLDGDWEENNNSEVVFNSVAYSSNEIKPSFTYKLASFFKDTLNVQWGAAFGVTNAFLTQNSHIEPLQQLQKAITGAGVQTIVNDLNIVIPAESKDKLAGYLSGDSEKLRLQSTQNVIIDILKIQLGGCQLSDSFLLNVVNHLTREGTDNHTWSLEIAEVKNTADIDELFDSIYGLAYSIYSEIISKPYDLCVLGITDFYDAEAIGRTMHLDFELPTRYFSATAQAIKDRLAESGDTVLTKAKIVNAATKLLPAEKARIITETALGLLDNYTDTNAKRGYPTLNDALNKWLEPLYNEISGQTEVKPVSEPDNLAKPQIPLIIPVRYDGMAQFYTHKTVYKAERLLASHLQAINANAKPLFKGNLEELEARITHGEVVFDKTLDEDQRKALIGLCLASKGIHTMTAGPGCGKTMMMEFLSYVLSGQDIRFVTPTGKAAKVLDSKVKDLGYNATTIYKFAANEEQHADIKLMVVDETSMLDIYAANMGIRHFLDNSKDAHIIFLGDTDQLPSVGTGKLLADLMATEVFDHHRLTKTFRNSGGILEYVKGVREGESLRPDGGAVEFLDVRLGSTINQMESTKMFHTLMDKVVSSVKENGVENTILLVPFREPVLNPSNPRYGSHWDVATCNKFLQDKINPNGRVLEKTNLRIGDRFINRKNKDMPVIKRNSNGTATTDGQIYVPNGEMGIVIGLERIQFKKGAKPVLCVLLKTDDDTEVAIESPNNGPKADKEFKSIQLGYAMTVHAAQGSQASHVFGVFPGDPAKKRFAGMSMNLLYTAASRAEKYLYIAGNQAVLSRIAKQPAEVRSTVLPNFIMELDTERKKLEETIGSDLESQSAVKTELHRMKP